MVARNFFTIALVLLCAMLTACSELDPQRLLMDAEKRSAKGDGAGAVIQVRQALALAPQDIEVLVKGARVYLQAGELVEAERALRSAQALGAKAEAVLPLLGRALFELERFPKVLEEIRPDPAWSPEARASIAMVRGQAELGLRAYERAKEAFTQASAVLPAEAKIALARVAAAQGNVSGAMQEADQVIAAHPDAAVAWVLKGDLLRLQGEEDDAIKAYQRAVAAAPADVVPLLDIAAVYISRRDRPAAHEFLAKAQKLAPAHPMVHFNQANLALQEKNYPVCQDALQRLLAVIPEHGPGTMLTAALMHATGNYALAIRASVGYLRKQPGSVMGRKLLAATLIKTGQPKSAIYYLEPVLEAAPDTASLALAGQAYLELGQVDKAQTLLERAASQDSKNVDLRFRLGVARLAGGHEAEGIVDLEAAVELQPDSSGANQFLVTALIGQNRLDQALDVVRRLEAAAPKSAQAQQLKGAVYVARQDDINAEKSFRQALSIDPGYFPAAAALARMLLSRQDSAGARSELEKSLRANPENLDALLFLASMDSGEGKRAEAIKRLSTAIELHPKAIQPYVALAAVHLENQQLDEALQVLQRGQSIDPSDPKMLELMGKIQSARGDYRGSIEALSRLQSMMPAAPGPLLQLALAHSGAGEHPAAIRRAREAVQLAPRNIEALTTYGLVLLQAGQYAEARKHALDVQRSFPRLPQGYGLEADADLALQDYAAAARALEKADDLFPSGIIRMKLHQASLRSTGAQEAERRLVQWIAEHPADPLTRHYLANVYASSGRATLAMEQYETLIKLNPADYRALNSMALVLEQTGDQRAIDYANRALKLRPNDPAVLDTAGWLLVGKGDVIRGLDLLRKAASLAPEMPTVRFHIAVALARAGDANRARRDLKELLASSKAFPEADEARALLKRLAQ